MSHFQADSNYFCSDLAKSAGKLGSGSKNIFCRLLGRCIGDSPKGGDCPPLGGHETALAIGVGGYIFSLYRLLPYGSDLI